MDNAERIWREKSDDELVAACAAIHEYTEEGERLIRAELLRRGLDGPPPPLGSCARCGRSIHATDPGSACAQCGEPFSEAIRSALAAAGREDDAPSEDGDDDDVVSVATFENTIEASLARSALEAAGIEAFVPGEGTQLQSLRGGFPQLMVRRHDYAAAIALLETAAASDAPVSELAPASEPASASGTGATCVIVFRSRLNPGVEDEYGPLAARMSELARTMPGYVSHKGFTAPDGERVTIVEFSSEEGLRAWSAHPEHVEAKRRGRTAFYSEYHIQVCTVVRERTFPS